ncbi:28S ribosomal protein S5, mitochondrial [Trichoplax sp. H2]|uniref:Small ribosomal subunit protein uS5m n=1 Tax=Trichoplax adhaerens TaxID=10228 RepID=B3S6D2_TRIAD|nr:hypothetical protein TRIADDRAFT_59764 [Trichoplax adhaerens]EDV21737.1 hypothetical protein TRIADDRAFT_59764 [Trichoplax adhaerens]RDD47356.1 28S ribosomal protein S5, mitochondrial [Trichoplax sp. H2]|eukprot:XP_002115885.1 hypothetical protein TRIADDRAFT_59764 [Trichoplax adhaerens]
MLTGLRFTSICYKVSAIVSNVRGSIAKCENIYRVASLNCLYTPLDQRNYTTALTRHEFNILRKAATGGRGRRGTRVKKKAVDFNAAVDKFKWPGYNAPLESTKLGKRTSLSSTEEHQEDQPSFSPRVDNYRSTLKKDLGRGWTGFGWGGRSLGSPAAPDGTILDEFYSTCIELRRVTNQTSGGKRSRMRALVIVGNKNGAIGYAFGKGQDVRTALRKAKNRAVNYLCHVDRCDGHTIFHDIKTKYKKTHVKMEKRSKGEGLRCHRAITSICELAGIADLRAKVIGSTNPGNIIHAAFKALQCQETFQQLSDRTNLKVVEFRPENGYRPVVVASPSSGVALKSKKSRIIAPHHLEMDNI